MERGELMKKCNYCGKEYPDAATICVIDHEFLVDVIPSSTGSQPSSHDQKSGSATCPNCGMIGGYRPIMVARGSFSFPIFFMGGIFAIIFRNAGRGRMVRCNNCETSFAVQTPFSKLAKILFWICVGPMIVFAVLLLFGVVVVNRHTPFRAEHWSLLYSFLQSGTWIEQLQRTADFVCFSVHRFQPLAFFPVVASYVVFKTRFCIAS